MNLGGWWYAGLAASVLLILSPYACHKWQQWEDRRASEAWERMWHG